MIEEIITCDICGGKVVYNLKQNLFTAGTLGNTEELDVCLDCTKKLSKFAQKIKRGDT